jgi:hypothetical protein
MSSGFGTSDHRSVLTGRSLFPLRRGYDRHVTICR